jgi:predicted transcriptional regulator
MNDILFLPVKPKWADLIMSGKKTLELRKRLPSKGQGNRCIVYASSPQRAIVGTCTFVAGRSFHNSDITETNLSRACVTEAEFDAYFTDQYFGAFNDPFEERWYGFELSHPTTFAKPISLEAMRVNWQLEPPQQWRYIDGKTFNEIVEAGR